MYAQNHVSARIKFSVLRALTKIAKIIKITQGYVI